MKIDGIEVHDADKPLLLHIRNTDTKTGKKNPSDCAAAKAAKRERGVLEARVFRSRTYLLKERTSPGGKTKKVWERYITPDALKGEIIAFDRGGEFEPDDYELQAPTKSQRLGAFVDGGSRGKTKKKFRPPHTVKNIRPLGPKR